jgi:hypothetical protein
VGNNDVFTRKRDGLTGIKRPLHRFGKVFICFVEGNRNHP